MKACYVDLRYYAYFVSSKKAASVAETMVQTIEMMYQMEKSIMTEFGGFDD